MKYLFNINTGTNKIPKYQFIPVDCLALYKFILYFAWEDQSEKVCCIDHKIA